MCSALCWTMDGRHSQLTFHFPEVCLLPCGLCVSASRWFSWLSALAGFSAVGLPVGPASGMVKCHWRPIHDAMKSTNNRLRFSLEFILTFSLLVCKERWRKQSLTLPHVGIETCPRTLRGVWVCCHFFSFLNQCLIKILLIYNGVQTQFFPREE